MSGDAPRRRGPGRPPTGHAYVPLRLRVPRELRAALEARAAERGTDLSTEAREALARGLREQG